MQRLSRLVAGVLLILVAAFCVFGFLASFEAGPIGGTRKGHIRLGWHGCLAAAGWLVLRRGSHPRSGTDSM